jgi:hypothetical protein
MDKLLKQAPLTALATLLAAAPALAETDRNPFEFRAGAGYRYDSNVSIEEIDQATSEADTAVLLDLGLGLNIDLTERLSLQADYDYSHTAYQEFSDFDLAIHQATAGLSYRADAFDAGLTGRYFATKLDGDGLLDLSQGSASLGRLFGDWLYLRGAYTASRKEFADFPLRDADNGEIRADAYYLIDGMDRYVSLGYGIDRENAVGEEFDYDGGTARLSYGHRLALGERPVDLKARMQFDNRDYDHVTAAIGTPRRDDRWRAGLSAAVPLWRRLNLEAEAQYADNASNLEAADYAETVVSLNLATEF